MAPKETTPIFLSFGFAFRGLFDAVRFERNMRIHTIAAALVIALAAWLRVPLTHWLALILAMTMVFSAEMFNRAMEAAVDLATDDWKPLAKTAKDVAAGSVLVAAMGAAAVGLLIFLPRLMGL